jgi:hypothetical protein
MRIAGRNGLTALSASREAIVAVHRVSLHLQVLDMPFVVSCKLPIESIQRQDFTYHSRNVLLPQKRLGALFSSSKLFMVDESCLSCSGSVFV